MALAFNQLPTSNIGLLPRTPQSRPDKASDRVAQFKATHYGLSNHEWNQYTRHLARKKAGRSYNAGYVRRGEMAIQASGQPTMAPANGSVFRTMVEKEIAVLHRQLGGVVPISFVRRYVENYYKLR